MSVSMKMTVFCMVMFRDLVDIYQCFGGFFMLSLQWRRVNIYQTAQRHVPKDNNLHGHFCESYCKQKHRSFS
jgi:hypothetical protein